VYWVVLRCRATVLLERRPESGVWGGLWGFPEFASPEAAASGLARLGFPALGAADLSPAAPVRHAFTHFELEAVPLLGWAAARPAAMEGVPRTWYNSREPASIGLAAPVARLLRRLEVDGGADPAE
jgi:A/G-specific adenine glycosylase